MLKAISIGLGVLVLAAAGLVAYASLRPDNFRVSRSASIAAPPEAVFALIADLRKFNTWNPYARKDPAMRGVHAGPDSGPGASYAWESDKVGVGKMTITDVAAPGRVSMRLDFERPFKATNGATFSIRPRDGGSDVTWTMEGAMPLVSKVIDVVIGLDRMLGRDFEEGLANLKAIAERK